MSDLFWFEWERCLDGYQILAIDKEKVVMPKSRRREIYRPLDLGTENWAPFHIFADMPHTQDGVLSFANSYGLLFRDLENGYGEFTGYSSTMRYAVKHWQKGDMDELVSFFQSSAGQWANQISVTLVKSNESDRPDLRIVPRDLLHALWLQFAEVISTGLKTKHCQWCRKAFPYGPGSRHRSTAIFCSSKCQKAHAYRKRLEASK